MLTNHPNRMPTTKQLIYRQIAEQGVASKAELLARFSMTGSMMTRLLEELVADRLILATGLGPSSGGRRPILYETNREYGYFFGLEISRFYSSLGFFDVRMNLMSFTRWRMDESMTPNRLVAQVDASMKAILRDHGIASAQVKGVGIGSVGPLDRERGLILRPQYFPSPDWSDVPICRMIEEITGFRAKLENGTNAALMGERWAMREKNPQHMLYVHAGVGLRSAMMSYGQLIHGSIDMEGAVGQMIIQTDGPRLQEGGNFGALEAYVSVQALERQAQSQARMGRGPWGEAYRLHPERLRYDDLLHALRQDDPLAVELFQRSAYYFGIGLANMINMLHPDSIVVGGALVYSREDYYLTAIEVARKHVYDYPAYDPMFSRGVLREDTVITGAALMAWYEMEI